MFESNGQKANLENITVIESGSKVKYAIAKLIRVPIAARW